MYKTKQRKSKEDCPASRSLFEVFGELSLRSPFLWETEPVITPWHLVLGPKGVDAVLDTFTMEKVPKALDFGRKGNGPGTRTIPKKKKKQGEISLGIKNHA
jgi:hypothetical protein